MTAICPIDMTALDPNPGGDYPWKTCKMCGAFWRPEQLVTATDTRQLQIAEAVKPWREALEKVVRENCDACGSVWPVCQEHHSKDETCKARALLDAQPAPGKETK